MSGQKSINCVNSESQFYHMKNRNNNLKKKKKNRKTKQLFTQNSYLRARVKMK